MLIAIVPPLRPGAVNRFSIIIRPDRVLRKIGFFHCLWRLEKGSPIGLDLMIVSGR